MFEMRKAGWIIVRKPISGKNYGRYFGVAPRVQAWATKTPSLQSCADLRALILIHGPGVLTLRSEKHMKNCST
jgi:hypothetical protein